MLEDLSLLAEALRDRADNSSYEIQDDYRSEREQIAFGGGGLSVGVVRRDSLGVTVLDGCAS